MKLALVLLAWGALVLAQLAFWIGVAWVAYHFISKLW
jgi:hypothetical protein